ncbi:hypothetical protein [Paraburkholderia kirstenboschensis]|uniref:Uncharacterized protein n=1 Tax=Paraburkholderia kirstenboschensis TaxID=1245436 RepID=A0ABZ0E8S1_9BURK|nr:hypothetical protein [Paraburkholderia kirstenboschensis]WOD13632.1 hypothetical protein RW095_06505 [Paraburkholderia kirstenboschensis]
MQARKRISPCSECVNHGDRPLVRDLLNDVTSEGLPIAGRERVRGAGMNYTIGSIVLGFVYSNATLNDAIVSAYVAI